MPIQIQTICNVFGAAVEKVIENLPETVSENKENLAIQNEKQNESESDTPEADYYSSEESEEAED
jgi:hypothetical protein